MSKIHDNYGEIIEYDGYKARISYDTQDHIFVGEILNIDDCILFHTKNEANIVSSFKTCIENYKKAKDQLI